MIQDLALAVVLGGAFGAGLLCLFSLVPRWAAPRLDRRIAPYLRDVLDAQGITPWPLAGESGPGQVLRAAAADAGARVGRLVGGTETLSRRLAQVGDTRGVEAFRARQLAWGLVGVVLGALGTVMLVLVGRGSPALAAVAPVMGLLGVFACEWHLQRRAARRRARLSDELPAVLEFLSLCLAAGEGLLDALRRVSRVGTGELCGELGIAVLEAGTGSTVADALGALSQRLELPGLTRAVDQLVASLERGAPLARVLQAQAEDAREDAKRTLIERAGRAEIAMLVPLVFLILPLSVLFAVYPGVFMIQLGLG